ncbi:hypothetical protein [Solitalea lacus]|uniref:hypothetical protein n=1 Tax=Solitalea lacus TaxID=2911172 RepID=UPI001EDA5FA3|nr:hypothetical protein [Solitalea lacus]UKJ06836.1 hypothetical protein L2B55_15015 [Solitalea lacus]
MNFLSHFYFDKHATDSNFVVGLVLPDLTKNFNKTWNIHPHKFEQELSSDCQLNAIKMGWQKHLLVDKHFHSSLFFNEETTTIKSNISSLLNGTPVRPYILAHIALELMLDSLLIENQKIDVAIFYSHLRKVNQSVIVRFLKINGIQQADAFINFYIKFIENEYLFTYTNYEMLVYALNRICNRIWGSNFTDQTKAHLQQFLLRYRTDLNKKFMNIFSEVKANL